MTDKLLVLEEFFAQQIWFLDWPMGERVYGATIKVEASGYLLVLRARTAEGPKVAFIGRGTLDGIRLDLRSDKCRAELKWREDKYALDRSGT